MHFGNAHYIVAPTAQIEICSKVVRNNEELHRMLREVLYPNASPV